MSMRAIIPDPNLRPTPIADLLLKADKEPVMCFEGTVKKVLNPFEPSEYGRSQWAFITDGANEICIDLSQETLHLDPSEEGLFLRFESTNTKHGWQGLKVNKFFSKKKNAETINIKITESCKFGLAGGGDSSSHAPATPRQSPAPASPPPPARGGASPSPMRQAPPPARPAAPPQQPANQHISMMDLAAGLLEADNAVAALFGPNHPLILDPDARQKLGATVFIEASRKGVEMKCAVAPTMKAQEDGGIVDTKTGLSPYVMSPDQLTDLLIRCAPYRGDNQKALALRKAAYAAMGGCCLDWAAVYSAYISTIPYDIRVADDAYAKVAALPGVDDPYMAIIEDQESFLQYCAAGVIEDDDIPF